MVVPVQPSLALLTHLLSREFDREPLWSIPVQPRLFPVQPGLTLLTQILSKALDQDLLW
jgi:hypothetical protein